MKLLIVDDELSSIEAVTNMIDQEKLQITDCFSAQNAKDAKNYLKNENIDIILCDIEMPQENGLELLEWIGKEQISVELIIMTCFAEFQYAKKAVSLGCNAYLLKPIDKSELEQELKKAIESKKKKEQLKQFCQSWIQNQDVVKEKFWLMLFRDEINSERESIRQWLKMNQIPINVEGYYCPFLFVIRKWGENIDKNEYNLYRFALKNIMSELFMTEGTMSLCNIIQLGEDTQLVITGSDSADAEQLAFYKMICDKYLSIAKEYIDIKINCYIGYMGPIWDIATQIEQLYQMDYYNLWNEGIYDIRTVKTGNNIPSYDISEFHNWMELLIEGEYQKTEKAMIHYLELQSKSRSANIQWLVAFQQQFMLMLGTFASQKKIYISQIITNETASLLFSFAGKSIPDMESFIHYSLEAIEKLDKKELYSKDPVLCTKAFIKQHLADELDMDAVSRNVHLNPDYLTRLFRKATGESVSKYIVKQRVEKAQQLLKTTNQPISEVAFQVGYYNYTSFNRIFTKSIGVSPQAYRQNCRNR